MKLHYDCVGPDDRPPLLFLHGFMGSGRDWDVVAAELSGRYRCVLVDLPGHGKTPFPPDPAEASIPGCAQALTELLDRLDIPRAQVIGYSMGARLALALAAHHPSRVCGVVLESGSPGLATASERAKRREWDEAKARQLDTMPLAEFLRAWYAQPLFASLARRPELLATTLSQRANNDPAALALAMRAMGTGSQPSLWEQLAGIELPVHLIVGSEDRKYIDLARRIRRECPAATETIVLGCGHNVHLESSGVFANVLLDYLARQESGPTSDDKGTA